MAICINTSLYVNDLARGICLLIDFVVPRIAHSHGLADPLLLFSAEPTGVATALALLKGGPALRAR